MEKPFSVSFSFSCVGCSFSFFSTSLNKLGQEALRHKDNSIDKRLMMVRYMVNETLTGGRSSASVSGMLSCSRRRCSGLMFLLLVGCCFTGLFLDALGCGWLGFGSPSEKWSEQTCLSSLEARTHWVPGVPHSQVNAAKPFSRSFFWVGNRNNLQSNIS